MTQSDYVEELQRNLTPQEVYDYYINQPSTKEPFTLFYTRKHKDGIEMKGQKFESKDETYCISLIESIMDLEDFLGWPFGDKKSNE